MGRHFRRVGSWIGFLIQFELPRFHLTRTTAASNNLGGGGGGSASPWAASACRKHPPRLHSTLPPHRVSRTPCVSVYKLNAARLLFRTWGETYIRPHNPVQQCHKMTSKKFETKFTIHIYLIFFIQLHVGSPNNTAIWSTQSLHFEKERGKGHIPWPRH